MSEKAITEMSPFEWLNSELTRIAEIQPATQAVLELNYFLTRLNCMEFDGRIIKGSDWLQIQAIQFMLNINLNED